MRGLVNRRTKYTNTASNTHESKTCRKLFVFNTPEAAAPTTAATPANAMAAAVFSANQARG